MHGLCLTLSTFAHQVTPVLSVTHLLLCASKASTQMLDTAPAFSANPVSSAHRLTLVSELHVHQDSIPLQATLTVILFLTTCTLLP